MNRRWVWATVMFALVVFGVVALLVVCSPWLQREFGPPVLALPADDEVAEVRASPRKSEIGFPETPEFVVPARHVSNLISTLRPAEYVRQPWALERLEQLGEVVIRTRDGGELRIRFFDAGHNPAILTVDGETQFYGMTVGDFGGVSLAKAVRDASLASRP